MALLIRTSYGLGCPSFPSVISIVRKPRNYQLTGFRRRRYQEPRLECIAWNPPVREETSEHAYTMGVSLPGVDPKDMDVSVQENILTVTARRRLEESARPKPVSGRQTSCFSRTVRLPERADWRRTEASYEGGRLNISVPLAEAAAARHVEVKSGGEARASHPQG